MSANGLRKSRLFSHPALFEAVDDRSSKNHQAEHNLLRLAADFHEVHAVLNDGNEQGPEQRSKHRALTARKRGSADHNRGDHLQLVVSTVGRGTALKLRNHEDAGDTR